MELQGEFLRLKRQLAKTILFVTHDLDPPPPTPLQPASGSYETGDRCSRIVTRHTRILHMTTNVPGIAIAPTQ